MELGYLETFKQVINKLSKNKSSPLPLVFPSIDSMEAISKKKPLLKGVFQVFDSRGFSIFLTKQAKLTLLSFTHPVCPSQKGPMRPTSRQ